MSWNIGDNRNLFLKLKSKLGLHHVVLSTPKTSPEKLTLTVVEMQQLPDLGKTDSKEELSCLNWAILNGRRKVCVNFQTDTEKLNIVVYRYWNNLYLKDNVVDLKLTEYQSLLAKQLYLLSYIDIFYKRCIILMKKLFITQTPSRMDILFRMSIFRLYPGLKMSFEHNSCRKNLFLSACFCWDSRLSLCEMDQRFVFGGLIGYGNSSLDSVIRYSKLFRLHAILHDAAGALRAHSGKGPGYCYMTGRGPNSCLLGHVFGLLFCLYVKIFLPFNFNSVDFWKSMSLIVLDIELTY